MPKRESAGIRLVMKRKMKSGKCPVAVQVCWRGTVASRYTGVWVEPSYWDDRNWVSRRCPEAPLLNRALSEALNAVNGRRLDYESAGIEYSAGDLLDDRPVPASATDFATLCMRMVRERRLKDGNHTLCINNLARYSGVRSMELTALTAGWLQGFAKDMERRGYKPGYIRVQLGVVRSVWNYAIRLGLVSATLYPFGDNSTFYKRYRQDDHKVYLTRDQLEGLESYFVSTYYTIDPGSGKAYPNKGVNYGEVYSRWASLNFWLMCYYLQGLSPYDVLKIRRAQVSLRRTGDIPYYSITGVRRSKTGAKVPIAVEVTDMVDLIFSPYYHNGTGEYFHPFFNRASRLEDMDSSKDNFLSTTSRNLKVIWDDVNRWAASTGWKDWVDIPRDATLYTSRHTFAQMYLESGGNIVGLASMLGRNVTGIGTYVRELTSDTSILDEKRKMMK